MVRTDQVFAEGDHAHPGGSIPHLHVRAQSRHCFLATQVSQGVRELAGTNPMGKPVPEVPNERLVGGISERHEIKGLLFKAAL